MEEIRIDCPAKINLFLEILSKRTDGYHEVITVMQTIDMHDRLLFREKKSGISIRCRETSVPTDENNLVFKTAQLLLNETGARRGVEVEIQKKIPVAAGLGGASSNAAAAFITLNRMWDLGLTKGDLVGLSSKIGTDVAFFVHLAMDDFSGFSGGTLLGRGRGNEMTHLTPLPPCWIILVAPTFAVSTKWAYENLNSKLTAKSMDFRMIKEASKTGDIHLISKLFFNGLSRKELSQA
jgi:4-diphosphocytidyl-2-C-methyl-D-erythritol kinase